ALFLICHVVVAYDATMGVCCGLLAGDMYFFALYTLGLRGVCSSLLPILTLYGLPFLIIYAEDMFPLGFGMLITFGSLAAIDSKLFQVGRMFLLGYAPSGSIRVSASFQVIVA
ncbi:hypothetical protein ACJX0J_024654, partial [Zea mays]